MTACPSTIDCKCLPCVPYSFTISPILYPRYRHAVLAHALSIILDSCPHHPTLLHALLMVSLQHGLASECSLLLEELFSLATHSPTQSMSPSVSSLSLPQVTSTLHSEYFISLLHDCTTTYETPQPALAHVEFTRVLVGILSEARPGYLDVWTCKAIRRLARRLRSEDLVAYTHLCTGLAHALASIRLSQGSKTKLANYRAKMEDRLTKWLELTLNALNLSGSSEDLDAVIGLLESLDYLAFPSSPLTSPDLLKMVQCLAAFCLVSPLYPQRAPGSQRSLCRILQGTKPSAQTYETLIHFILRDLSITTDLFVILPTLETWAACLRSQSLLRHEASFWSSALQIIENCTLPGSCSEISPPLLVLGMDHINPNNLDMVQTQHFEKVRIELVRRVEDAEGRCFGDPKSGCEITSKPTDALGDGEWMWEEMVGTWVRKSPLVSRLTKKPALQRELNSLQGPRNRKRVSNHEDPAVFRKRQKIEPIKYPPVESASTTSVSPESSSSYSSSRISRSHSPARTGHAEADITPPSSPFLSPCHNEEFEAFTPPKPSNVSRERRISNFESLLADAHSNVAILHKKPITGKRSSVSQVKRRPKEESANVDRNEMYMETLDLSSDDALNLFAASSPVVARTRFNRQLE